MPTLHLPAAHTDTDVALAAKLASIVGSHSCTDVDGEAGRHPSRAILRDGTEPVSPFAEVVSRCRLGGVAVHPIAERPVSRMIFAATRVADAARPSTRALLQAIRYAASAEADAAAASSG
jgi:hypothetical protein